MDRQYILDEIRRTAIVNGGVPLGRERFQRETGVKYYDWYGRYWTRWGDAVSEAGFTPNKLREAYDETVVLEKYIDLMRGLGRIPVDGDLRIRAHVDKTFPHTGAFGRLGTKAQLVAKVLDYARLHEGYEDVVDFCSSPPTARARHTAAAMPEQPIGFVYLIRVGRYYKIGRSNSPGRRERELAIQLPEKSRTMHVIRTDDPIGIEAYWHKRFESKRKNGEWFELTSSDISSFTRRKYI
jgi:hypothetical protein